MQKFEALREISAESGWKKNDVLVVFGEVFARGYVNGLIDEAKAAGLKVIYSTVGRRDENGELRPLTPEELAQKDQPLLNIPLECGFDMEKSSKGLSPCDQLKGLKLSEAHTATLDMNQVAESRAKGRASFRERVQVYMQELQTHIPADANILFAHTMAGGVPRAKIILPVMNRVFKGHGERFASSKDFWQSQLGEFSALSFMDVTANSLADLIELSRPLQERAKVNAKKVSFVAFGYHGTEILMKDQYRWQSYSPYLQGFAKLELERIAKRAGEEGINAVVFNAPEILTNSSSIFLGVEVALYPLIGAFKKAAPDHPVTKQLIEECERLLKPEHTVDEILAITDKYFRSEIIAERWSDYPSWPQHNGPEQMEQMRLTSDQILHMHKDERHLLTAHLSELVFRACGKAMFYESLKPKQNVYWVGHDLVAKLSLRE